MNKTDFLEELRKGLSGLPRDEAEERIGFYAEMIDDRMEEGLSEQEAISEIGTVDEIVSQIIAEIPLSKIVKDKLKPKRRLSVTEIVLLAVGSPIWLSLLIAAFAVIFSLYASLWSVIISVWAAFAAFIGSAFGGALSGVILMVWDSVPNGLALLSCAFVLAGLSIFLFYGCKAATKGIVLLTKKIWISIKKCFIKKEAA